MNRPSFGPEAHPPLRVGLLLDALVQPRWRAAMIADLLDSPAVEVVLVIVSGAPPPARWQVDRGGWAYRAYTRLDRALFSVETDASAPIDVTERLAGMLLLTVAPAAGTLPTEAILAVQDYDLDVAVQCGFGPLGGSALSIARYGVWSIRLADGLSYDGDPPGFWEVMRGDPVSGCSLLMHGGEAGGKRILMRGFIATYRLSTRRNCSRLMWKARPFLSRKLAELQRDGPAALDPLPPDAPDPDLVGDKPRSLAMIGLGLRLLVRILRDRLIQWLTVEQWALAVDVQPGRSGPAESLAGFTVIQPPRDRFWADPFPVEKDGRSYLFFEEYIYQSRIGRIVAAEVDASGRLVGDPRPVLERDFHLSYPFIFAWQDELYMIPEMAQAGRIELYRCREFPYQWDLVRTLLDGVRSVDATLAEIDGHWWMFAGLPVGGGVQRDVEVHLYHADSPLGPWQAHPRSPVAIDVRGARPAGRLYQREGVWYRPAQDGSANYGYAITLHRIERIDPEQYVETPVGKILPDWHRGLIGTHTLNADGPLTVADGLFRRWRF